MNSVVATANTILPMSETVIVGVGREPRVEVKRDLGWALSRRRRLLLL